MANTLKERREIDEQYRWDLSSLYPSDAAFEKDFEKLEGRIAAVAACEGTLTTAPAIRTCLEDDTALDLLLSDLFCYA
ncbi:MAG: oligoendopeptidase F, partial [Clostridia bacterium]|nr:oligoendopeptidase F [Clostridia bacterium]